MPRIFVSHASADKVFVDEFVAQVLRLGCELKPSEIFYSSGADTGVPLGKDLLTYVRTEVDEADLVIAVVSPTYQTRPVCVAELGAAWSVAGKLVPLLTPGLSRSTLEGVLPPLLTKHIDDRAALDELHDLIGEVVGHTSTTPTWGEYSAIWRSKVKRLARTLPTPVVIDPKEHEALLKELESTQAALETREERVDELEEQLREVSALKDRREVLEIVSSKDYSERLQSLAVTVKQSFAKLSPPVQQAIYWQEIHGEGMPMPIYSEDPYWYNTVDSDVKSGELIATDAGEDGQPLEVAPDYEYEDAERAGEAVNDFKSYFEDMKGDPDFIEWFKEQYGVPANLKKHATWDSLV